MSQEKNCGSVFGDAWSDLKTWKPFYMVESDNLIDTWVGRVRKYLDSLPVEIDRISSRSLKAAIKADKVAPTTWTLVLRKVCNQLKDSPPNKESYGRVALSFWKVEGRSLVRQTAEVYGFAKEAV